MIEFDIDKHYHIVVGVGIAVCVILFTFVIWSIISGESKMDGKVAEEIDSEDDKQAKYDEIMDKIRNKRDPNEYLSGKTEKYEWRQNDNELDLFLPVSSSLKSKEVVVSFKSRHLTVKVQGDTVIDGDLYEELNTEESNWQFDGSGESRKIEINLVKKKPTKAQDHWKGVIVDDNDLNSCNKGPPVHFVDKNDPAAIRDALSKISFS